MASLSSTSRIARIAALYAIALLALANTARAQTSGLCYEPTGSARLTNFVVIDANTGQVLEGATRFFEGDRVQVIVKNKNPFKYAYRTTIASAPLETRIQSDYLGVLDPVIRRRLEGLTTSGSIYDILGKFTAARDPNKPCYENALDKVKSDFGTIVNEIGRQKGELKAVVDLYDEFIHRTDGDRINCDQRVDEAQRLLPSLDELATLDRATSDLNILRNRINYLDIFFSQLVNSVPKDSTICHQALVEARQTVIARLNGDASSLGDAVVQIKNERQKFRDLASIIRSALASGSSFVETIYPNTIGGGRTAQVTIFRRSLRDRAAAETPVGSVDLRIEGLRSFSVSAGVGISTLPQIDFLRRPGQVPIRDAAGNVIGDSIGTVFGYAHNSRFFPTPVVMMTGHIARLSVFGERDLSFGLSLGGALNLEDIDLQYLGGITLGELDDQLLLTFAYHVGRVDSLAGGFRIGDPVPANLPDPLPTERNWRSAFMFAVTYKLR